MKTIKEITEKAVDKSKEALSFWPEVLLEFLTYEQAKPLLKPDYDGKDWPKPLPLTREIVVEKMREYMSFAWDKAENHRGISASRSVDKMHAWTWLIGEDNQINWDNYQNYGCPILKQICEKYGFNIPKSEALVRMSQGLVCGTDYDCGCGR